MSDLVGKTYMTKHHKKVWVVEDFVRVSNTFKLVCPEDGTMIHRSEAYIKSNFIEVVEEKPPTDVGDDLVGKKAKNTSTGTVYSFVSKHTKDKKPAIKMTWVNDGVLIRDVGIIRDLLLSSVWEMVTETKTEFKSGDSVMRVRGKAGLAAKLNTRYTVASMSKNDGQLRLSEVGGSYTPGNWILVDDKGEDLIGRKFTRGGTCVYKFYSFNSTTGNMRVTWNGGTDNFYSPKKCRDYLSGSTGWAFVGEEVKKKKVCDLKETPKEVSSAAYKSFVAAGWEHHEIMSDLDDGMLQRYLDSVGKSDYKIQQIRQIVQNISGYAEKLKNPEPEPKYDEIYHGDWTDGKSITDFKTKPVKNSLSEKQWQAYSALTELYETLQEEETTMSNTRHIDIKVPTSAFATVPAFDVSYGQRVDEMDERALFSSLRSIDEEINVLKDLNLCGKSKRVNNKVDALDAARKGIVNAIDNLPEDEA